MSNGKDLRNMTMNVVGSRAALALLGLMLGSSACGAGADDSSQFEDNVSASGSELILNVHNGVDDVWTTSERVNITYCVSTNFGKNYLRAVHEMHQATQDWEKAAYVNFIYKGEYDSNCTWPDAPVTFTVESIFLGTGEAGAESFPPSYVHEGQPHYLGIALDAYDTLNRSVDKRTSRGTFSHELGHILGFRHEHIRPEANNPPFNYNCNPEPVSDGNDPWRTIPGFTQYDPNSVMHYGVGGCGPLKDYALTATDRGAVFKVYPAPTRCEVWLGTTKLGQTTVTPTSAEDGDNKCRAYAVSTFQNNGKLFSGMERRTDHYRAVMQSSSSKPCAFTDSVLLWTPGVGFARPSDVVWHELILGKVQWTPANPVYDNYLMARFGGEVSGRVGYLYDTANGFIKNGFSRNVSICGNDQSMVWEIAKEDTGLYETVNGEPVSGTLKPVSYGTFSLSLDGMGGNDSFYGGNGIDIFTDLSGDNSARGFGGNDTLKLCNYSAIDCGSGTADKAQTCATDTTGSVVACESRTTF